MLSLEFSVNVSYVNVLLVDGVEFYNLTDFFCLVLSIVERGLLKPSTIIVNFSVYLSATRFCFTYFVAFFGAYTFMIDVSPW